MTKARINCLKILGVDVHLPEISQVLDQIDVWVQERTSPSEYIVATGMHGVLEAHNRPYFRTVVNSAALLVPDGISLVIIARARKYNVSKRITGSDLMWDACGRAEMRGYRMFFYGDSDDTLDQLKLKLRENFPDLIIAGTHSPPFRPLTPEEDEQEIKMINDSGADIIWVGLGLPKQEEWIYHHRDRLNVPVAVGVGAAFKFTSGRVKRAPAWVGDNGFEWLWRLIQEPKRVWKRVLIDGPHFIFCVVLEIVKHKTSKA